MGIIKGKQVRIELGGATLACAKSCTLHSSARLEKVSHKDTTGDWDENESVGLAWDFTAEALTYVSGSGATIEGKTFDDVQDLLGQKVEIEFVQDGTKTLRKGTAIINDISQTFANEQSGTYTVQGTGSGPLTKGV